MLNSIHKLISEVYESSITEKNAKISALQSQINPHFLYNTLNIMKSISRVKGVEEVAEISEALSDLFKYSMKDLDKEVTLLEEINHIENYMRIQQHRFRNRYRLQVNMTEQVKQASIPKLMIQPLVENAVNHGLKDIQENGLVTITAFQKEQTIYITVIDNGAGISEDKLQLLNRQLNRKIIETNDSGVGLTNVSQRLRLMYGARYQLQVVSKENEGTKVTIQLPFNRKGSK
ncbi:sensor histidine kinase [Alkalihalobacillus hemicellulosilyticus]|uniref:histidine kinase n=1 Tax=Halalkalibacter hemicellulosilyticusJCM 9152 TaxID=1236971 RepID=W4QA16_9BACI|nr:histidine kinase [Halalkalibacter hemicellulosilyticus]GAE28822.1 histidine kinase internal region [Halalkalibacter hemicellulosilyticusJCM 9152]